VTDGHAVVVPADETTSPRLGVVLEVLAIVAVSIAVPTALAALVLGWIAEVLVSTVDPETDLDRLISAYGGALAGLFLVGVATSIVLATIAGVRGGRPRRRGMIAGTLIAFTFPVFVVVVFVRSVVFSWVA
jgi:hypothetical protein